MKGVVQGAGRARWGVRVVAIWRAQGSEGRNLGKLNLSWSLQGDIRRDTQTVRIPPPPGGTICPFSRPCLYYLSLQGGFRTLGCIL